VQAARDEPGDYGEPPALQRVACPFTVDALLVPELDLEAAVARTSDHLGLPRSGSGSE
jgi:hypothetical protein